MLKKIVSYASIFIIGFSSASASVAFGNEQLIALNDSDVADTCWKTSYSSGIVQHTFNSNGTYERVQYINNPMRVVIWTGNWEISSNTIWEKVKYVTYEGRTTSSPNNEWEQSFVVRDGKLVGGGTYVYTLGCN